MTQSLPVRTELHVVQTLTLSDRQFLRGEPAGGATALGGLLSLPQGAHRHPTVLMMHGSGGINASMALWMRQINARGIATFVLDGLTGRNLVSVTGDQARLGRLAFVLDIYRALAILADHPAIDPSRLVLLGFSRGGQATLYAGLSRFHRLWNQSGVCPLATVALYPDCGTLYLEDTVRLPGSLRVFHGTADDMNPILPVREHITRLRLAGHDASLHEYSGGHHGFDDVSGAVRCGAMGWRSAERARVRH